MRFSWKIFVYTYIIIMLSFGIGGFLIIETSFKNNIRFRQDSLKESNQYLTESYLSMVNIDTYLNMNMAENYRKNVIREDKNTRVFIGKPSQVTGYEKTLFKERLKTGNRMIQMIEKEGEPFLQVVSMPDIKENRICIENLENISDIYQAREVNYHQFQMILLAVSVVSGSLLLLFSAHLTKPLKRLSVAAAEIGNGRFDKRVKTSGSTEIRSLTKSFNCMAEYMEKYIKELQEENRRREDFVNNFTHELKTPLTSIIGYADLLRSYDAGFEKRRQFAEYIYHEGTRLEALALHLMDLIVLQKQEFDLKPVHMKYFFAELEKTLLFVMEKYHTTLHIRCDFGMAVMEKDLMATLVYNLVDNGCKAMAGNEMANKTADIYVLGYMQDRYYEIVVKDTGIGIEEEELLKITEPFYMVDKSRARTMGGAGLGLALCREIAKIHGSNLNIVSKKGKGTEISVYLKTGGEEA